MRPTDVTAIARENDRSIEVALWNRGASVYSQVDTIPPRLVKATLTPIAVARR